MGGGSQRGLIIGNLDPVTGRGEVFSIIARAERTSGWSAGTYGPRFGPAVRELYELYRNVSEPPLQLRVTNRAERGDGSVGANASVSTSDGEVRGLGSVRSGQSVQMVVPLEAWDTFTVSALASGHSDSLTVSTPDPPVVSVEFGGNALVGFEFQLVDPGSAPIPDQVPAGGVDVFGSFVWKVGPWLLVASGVVLALARLKRVSGARPPRGFEQPGRPDRVLVVSVDGDGMPLLDIGPDGALRGR